jgi:DNA repair protein RadC
MNFDQSRDHLQIPQWAEDDRPREKLLLKGRSSLSDAELLAILIGTGTKSFSAVDLAKQILQKVEHDINNLARLSVNDLTKIKGIGKAKAISIVSALELGRRRKETNHIPKPRITCSTDVVGVIKPDLLDLNHEEFWIIVLNRANYVLKKIQISRGGISGTVADPKLIFKSAIEQNGSSIILIHNHPSGNLNPSQADINLTKNLKEAGKFMEIPVLDHIIVSDNYYFSFADEGLI